MPDGDDVADVLRPIEGGLGLGPVAGEELPIREIRAASDGEGGENVEAIVVASEGLALGGCEVRGEVDVDGDGVETGECGVVLERNEESYVLAGNEVKLEGEDELEGEEGEGDVEKVDVGGGSELLRVSDGDEVDCDVRLETVAATEDDGVDGLVEVKGDIERVYEGSKMVEEEDGGANVAGNSGLSGMVVEDCPANDVVEEIGEGFGKVDGEECEALTACSEMEQIDQCSEKVKKEGGEEDVVGDSDLIATGIL